MTATLKETLKSALDEANLNKLADALGQIDLGSILTPVEHDTGVITGATSITLPGLGALLVQSVRVVSGTETAGEKVVSDSGSTPGDINTSGVFSCKLNAAGTAITFSANVTRVVVRYIPNPAKALTDAFTRE
jgi:predicted naringenin-chalcone synthase